MEMMKKLNARFESIAWGALFLWWGLTSLYENLPEGLGGVGIGLILIGLNAARKANGIPVSKFTSGLGILALALGGLDLARVYLHFTFELPVFALMLVLLGALIIGQQLVAGGKESVQ